MRWDLIKVFATLFIQLFISAPLLSTLTMLTETHAQKFQTVQDHFRAMLPRCEVFALRNTGRPHVVSEDLAQQGLSCGMAAGGWLGILA